MVVTRHGASTTAATVTTAAVVLQAMVLLLLQAPGAQAVTDSMLKIACSDMTPRHPGYKAENVLGVPCPYRLIIDSPVVPGNLVNVTLTSVNKSIPFKGFMVQARDADGRPIGTFLPECRNVTQHHMITCSNGNEPYVSFLSKRVYRSGEISGGSSLNLTPVYPRSWVGEGELSSMTLSARRGRRGPAIFHRSLLDFRVYDVFKVFTFDSDCGEGRKWANFQWWHVHEASAIAIPLEPHTSKVLTS